MKRIAIIALVAIIVFVGALPARAQDYEIDPVHSFVRFTIGYGGIGEVFGRFDGKSGTVSFDQGNTPISIDFTIDASSVHTGFEKRDQHLRSPDFFDTKQFPSITFKSSSITSKGDGFEVEGTITFHGVSKTLVTTFQIIGENDKAVGGRATFVLNRSKFGVNFMAGNLSDEVNVDLAIIAKK